MELYKVETRVKVIHILNRSMHVLASSDQEAKKEAQKICTECKNIQIFNEEIESVIPIELKPILIIPVKGEKRTPITPRQKDVLRQLIEGGEHAKLLYSPDIGWQSIGKRVLSVDIRTVVALRLKNLIKPITMTTQERTIQQTLGTMKVGQFIFILNMKEVMKRKVYHDSIQKPD